MLFEFASLFHFKMSLVLHRRLPWTQSPMPVRAFVYIFRAQHIHKANVGHNVACRANRCRVSFLPVFELLYCSQWLPQHTLEGWRGILFLPNSVSCFWRNDRGGLPLKVMTCPSRGIEPVAHGMPHFGQANNWYPRRKQLFQAQPTELI